MKHLSIIIAGSRDIVEYKLIEEAVAESGWRAIISEVVSGCCRGVDKLGELYANNNNIPIKKFPADWSRGKMAGPLRNIQMGDYADALIAVKLPTSKGTEHMIKYMKSLGKPVYVKVVKE